ncbi:MAG: hypothetical protein IKR81_10950 [Victivallales bacterium]|nr:hypothetical protein [Victivallales bacterium]
MRLLKTIAAVFLTAFLLLGCHKQPSAEGKEEAKAAEKLEPTPYSKEFESGPLKIRLTIDKTHLRLDEVIQLELEAWAPEEYSVELPKLESGMEQFRWEPISLSTPELQDGGLLHYSRKILLEPLVIYEKTAVGPMEVKFAAADKAGGEVKNYSLTTDEVEITVEMPPEEYWNNLTVNTAISEEPVTRLERKTLWWPYAVAAVLLLVALLVVVLLRRKHVKEVELPPPVPPYEIALEELRRLVEAHLVEQGDFMGFYNAIQGILRRYIEARFDIHAPERTTEEFLAELRGSHSPIGQHQKLLESFLTHCDLVRFAKHTPEKQEIQATFDACKQFIIENQ